MLSEAVPRPNSAVPPVLSPGADRFPGPTGCGALRRAANALSSLGLMLACLGLPGVAESQEKPKILLLPVVVHSAESPGYLRRGLSDMLMARFQQGDHFELIEVEDPELATTSPEKAVETARAQGADFVLFGSFTRFGEGASLDMHAAATAEASDDSGLREIFVHSGQIGEVIPDLDDLVGKVTRFAIEDFTPSAVPSGGSGASAAKPRVSVADLQRRVEKLEQQIEALSGSSNVMP